MNPIRAYIAELRDQISISPITYVGYDLAAIKHKRDIFYICNVLIWTYKCKTI